MANPVLVPCPVGLWTKVATNVKSGNIWIMDRMSDYFHTYRDTGESAPSSDDEAVRLAYPGRRIESDISIDVYIKAKTQDGIVRVDTL